MRQRCCRRPACEGFPDVGRNGPNGGFELKEGSISADLLVGR